MVASHTEKKKTSEQTRNAQFQDLSPDFNDMIPTSTKLLTLLKECQELGATYSDARAF